MHSLVHAARSWGLILLVFGLACWATACGARTGLSSEERPFPDAAGMDAGRDVGLDAGLDVSLGDVPVDAARDAGMDAPLDVPGDTPRDAPVDTALPDAGDPCEISPGPLRAPLCTRAIFGNPPVLSCPAGFVDVAARGDGVLVWECDGIGAEARFGTRTYRGQRVGDRVELCIRTEFDYTDGCRWQSDQRIRGDTSTASLALSYREMPIAGVACAPACTADSVIELR